jgi:hypothetical protein
MAQYQRRLPPIEAIRFSASDVQGLMSWASEHAGGVQGINWSPLCTKILIGGNKSVTVKDGDWIVSENGKLFVVGDTKFHLDFVEMGAAVRVLPAVPAPAPAMPQIDPDDTYDLVRAAERGGELIL